MRRNEKAVTDRGELEAIIRAGKICRLALTDEPIPYLVPLNYGFRDGALYFHSAREGRKIELMKAHPPVAFEISLDLGIVAGEQACNWGATYRCVMGQGRIEFIEAPEEKRQALDAIMAQYATGEFSYPDAAIDKTCVYRLVIEQMTGKQSGV